jgi:hypothetical protein
MNSPHIFVYEYTCATTGAAESLGVEGWAMLSALLHDFAALPGVRLTTLLGATVSAELPSTVNAIRIDPDDEEPAFRDQARAANLTLVIAPEFDDLLANRCQWVVEAGGRLLNSLPDTVRLAADKLALGRLWNAHGIPTPACHSAGPEPPTDLPFPAVHKPRFGAGSQATFLVRSPSDWPAVRRQAAVEFEGESVVQPFAPGLAASVAFLAGPRGLLALPPCEQLLSADGRFHYHGGRVPLAPELAARATHLARRAAAAVPDLLGYIGIDLILGEALDGTADQAIELNPRLTTSYVGLRALCRDNLAAALLRVANGADLPALRWQPDVFCFSLDGTVS